MFLNDFPDFQLNPADGEYILIGQVGSKSYGTNTPESDDDWMGIAIAPLSHYIGLDNWKNDGSLKIERKEQYNAEMSVFELRKFLRLMLSFNPNVVPLLYLRPKDYVYRTKLGNLLIDNRHLFSSKAAHRSLIGYAKGQMNSVIKCNTGKLGTKRKELVAQFGYDVKYAAHTVRILNMAIEFFETCELNVYREWDQNRLMSIRTGEWELEEWIECVKVLISRVEEAEKRSYLPEFPNKESINDLCMEIIKEHHSLCGMN